MAVKKDNIQPITQAELEAWVAADLAHEKRAYDIAMRAFKGAPVEAGRIGMEPVNGKPIRPSHAECYGIRNGSLGLHWD